MSDNHGTTVKRYLERRRLAKVLAPVLAASLLLAACGGDDNEKTEAPKTSAPSGAVNDHGTKDLSGKPSADVELDDFYFEPTTLEGEPGQKISLRLENAGTVEHNLSLPEQDIDQDVEKGEKASVKLTFPKSGTLRFFCKYHEAQKMAGSLAVAGSSGGGADAPSGGGDSGGY